MGTLIKEQIKNNKPNITEFDKQKLLHVININSEKHQILLKNHTDTLKQIKNLTEKLQKVNKIKEDNLSDLAILKKESLKNLIKATNKNKEINDLKKKEEKPLIKIPQINKINNLHITTTPAIKIDPPHTSSINTNEDVLLQMEKKLLSQIPKKPKNLKVEKLVTTKKIISDIPKKSLEKNDSKDKIPKLNSIISKNDSDKEKKIPNILKNLNKIKINKKENVDLDSLVKET